ncbi:MAG: hypothetical protein KAH54_08195 [Candidatus Sabulitectum sp.]|nr:hypothetical protein [Candidatus Sabulitectum sp.]
MLFIMMALFGSVTVNEVSLDASILDNVQDEWIAPGYEIAEEIIIDPLDYGVPQDDRDGTPRIIGFQSFFVQTPEGEKWRIVLTYDRKVVVLQEDAEQREFEVERSIRSMINSKDGRYLIIRFLDDYYSQQTMAISGLAPPEKRTLLINIDEEIQSVRTGIEWISYLGGNGYGVASRGDSIYFYDDRLNLVNTRFNKLAHVLNNSTSLSNDGSLFVTLYADSFEVYEEGLSSLRAYDCNGNVLWDAEPAGIGRPGVSEHGDFVFALGQDRLVSLDGRTGLLLWEQPFENRSSFFAASLYGAGCSFKSDLSPAGVRENPDRERALYVATTNIDGNSKFSRISFSSRSIRFFYPSAVNATGSSLWQAVLGERLEYSNFLLCLFLDTGELLYSRRISKLGYLLNGHGGKADYLPQESIDSIAKKIIWFDGSVIHILTLEKEGISE